MIKTQEDLYLESQGIRSNYALLCSGLGLINSFINETRHLLTSDRGYLSQFRKHALYSYYFPDIAPRTKFTGFEKVQEQDKKIREYLIQQIPVEDNTLQNSYNASHGTFEEELRSVLSTIENPLLYLSGGIDSEFVARWFLKFKIPFDPITISWSFRYRTINLHDINYAVNFCKLHDLTYREINIDLEQYWKSEKLLEVAHAINRTSPQHCAYVMAVEHIDGILKNKTHIMSGENRYVLVNPTILDK